MYAVIREYYRINSVNRIKLFNIFVHLYDLQDRTDPWYQATGSEALNIMRFNGMFTIKDVTVEEVWLALSDPVMIKQALPGCEFLVEVEDPDNVDFDVLAKELDDDDRLVLPETDPETVADRALEEGSSYAALMELSVGSIKPTFKTVVTIEERELPEMEASGEGSASNSSFEMASGMTLTESDGGVQLEWWSEADVFGRIAQMGERVINPVANQVIKRFFGRIEDQLRDVSDESDSLRERIRKFV